MELDITCSLHCDFAVMIGNMTFIITWIESSIKKLDDYRQYSYYVAYRPFRHGTFWQESFRHGCFITGTFRHMHCSALRTFQQMDFSTPERFDMGNFGMGNFRHEEFSAPEHFGTGIFRHLNISAQGYFGTLQSNMDVLAQTFRDLCYCAKMTMCRNVPVPKIPRAAKILVLNLHLTERLERRMVHVPKCSLKLGGDQSPCPHALSGLLRKISTCKLTYCNCVCTKEPL